MRVIIAGSRGVIDPAVVTQAMERAAERGIVPSSIVSGTARGADQLGEAWARERGIPVTRYPADWTRHGKAAGHRRNAQMADNADALVALWDGESPGTEGMIRVARSKGLSVYIWITENTPAQGVSEPKA